jgi:hypothetical protein
MIVTDLMEINGHEGWDQRSPEMANSRSRPWSSLAEATLQPKKSGLQKESEVVCLSSSHLDSSRPRRLPTWSQAAYSVQKNSDDEVTDLRRGTAIRRAVIHRSNQTMSNRPLQAGLCIR